MATERLVAGIRCGEVLADLSEYLDGSLAVDRRTQIEDHVRGCDYCERFGHRFSSAITTLRLELRTPAALDPALAGRLHARLRRETS